MSLADTKKDKKKRTWFFTWNSYPENFVKVITETQPTKYAFQLEEGTETKQLHIQGILMYKNPIRFNTLQKWFPGIHIELPKSIEHAVAYCQKLESRVEGPWVYGWEKIKHYRKPDFPWQTKLMEIIQQEQKTADESDTIPRSIHWIWEDNGAQGKTHFAKYMAMEHKALVVSGSAADIMYAATMYKKHLRIAIIDIPRVNENHVSYRALEQLRNGLWFNTKYESGMVAIPSPVVIIFANEPPDINKLSLDRWRIWNIIDKDLLEDKGTLGQNPYENAPPAGPAGRGGLNALRASEL